MFFVLKYMYIYILYLYIYVFVYIHLHIYIYTHIYCHRRQSRPANIPRIPRMKTSSMHTRAHHDTDEAPRHRSRLHSPRRVRGTKRTEKGDKRRRRRGCACTMFVDTEREGMRPAAPLDVGYGALPSTGGRKRRPVAVRERHVVPAADPLRGLKRQRRRHNTVMTCN